MRGAIGSSQALSPLLLLTTAALLSVGAPPEVGASAAMIAGDQQALTQLVEAIATVSGAVDDQAVPHSPQTAFIDGPLVFELTDGPVADLAPTPDRTPTVRPLLRTLTNLPPPQA